MILVLNCGSQSIKWKLFDYSKSLGLKALKEGKRDVFVLKNYQNILENELKGLTQYSKDIKKIGHRVVCAGEKLRKPIKIDDNVLKEIDKFSKTAPLHNPYNILGAEIAIKFFPKAEQIAFFDTEFFSNLPSRASAYAIPEKYGFRRLGFHGISHSYCALEGAKLIKKPFNKLKIITCHLGGGSSITAVKNGKAIDTSMGYTPMEGLVMMTRSGSIDPGIILELAQNEPLDKIRDILNNESGIKAVCGQKEMLAVLKKAKKGDKKSRLALDIFSYSVKKYIGAYYAILGGCDLLVFTGTIGCGSSKIRNMICKDMAILKNTRVISIKTDEELAIARKIK